MKQKFWRIIEEANSTCNGNLILMFETLKQHFQKVNPAELSDWAKVIDEHTMYGHEDSLLEIPASTDSDEMDFGCFCQWLVAQGERFYHAIQQSPQMQDISQLAQDLDTGAEDLVKAPVFAYLKSLGHDEWRKAVYKEAPEVLSVLGNESYPEDFYAGSYRAFGKLYLLFYLCRVMSGKLVA